MKRTYYEFLFNYNTYLRNIYLKLLITRLSKPPAFNRTCYHLLLVSYSLHQLLLSFNYFLLDLVVRVSFGVILVMVKLELVVMVRIKVELVVTKVMKVRMVEVGLMVNSANVVGWLQILDCPCYCFPTRNLQLRFRFYHMLKMLEWLLAYWILIEQVCQLRLFHL